MRAFHEEDLKKILKENKDKRVAVLGTTCTGKTTFLKKIKGAYDMDKLVFPKLTETERDFVCRKPWTPEIGRAMTKLTKKNVIIEMGTPVFGTVVLDSDLIVYLHISDDLLRKRTKTRKTEFKDAKNMQKQIEKEIERSKIPCIKISVG